MSDQTSEQPPPDPVIASADRGLHGVVLLTGLAITLVAVIRLLAPEGWDPSTLATIGEDSGAVRAYAEETLGRIVLAPSLGHDGKYFFVQAIDPFALDAARSARLVDRPVYRLQRVLYPLLAGGFGLLSPHGILWGLIAVNVAAMALGTWATAQVAVRMGISPWLGLAFPLNPGMLFESFIDGSGVLAWALAILGIMFLIDRRAVPAGFAWAGASLAREVMLLTTVAALLWLWRTGRRPWWLVWAVIPTAVWAAVLRVRFPPDPPTEQVAFDWPFAGLVKAFRLWMADPGVDLLVGCVIVLITLVLLRRVLRDRSLLGWCAMGHVYLLPFLSVFTWYKYFDLARAAAPAITAALLITAPKTHVLR